MKNLKAIWCFSVAALLGNDFSYSSTCPSFSVLRSEKPIEKGIAQSHMIFIGEAITTITRTNRTKGYEEGVLETNTKFEIIEPIKGKAKQEIIIEGNLNGDCGCNYVFEPGVKYLVFANESKGRFQTTICELVMPVNDALFSEVLMKVKESRTKNKSRGQRP